MSRASVLSLTEPSAFSRAKEREMVTKFIKVIDIGEFAEISRLIDDAEEAGGPVVLRRGGRDVAVLSPLAPDHMPTESIPHQEVTDEDRAAFRAAAGGWKDFDADAFLEQNRASREAGSRPPVDL